MTKNADFKKLVRARMAKTGESYAAARAQLLDAPSEPGLDEYADLAGMADDAVAKKTGKTWLQWVTALDAEGARTLDHTAIARLVGEQWPDIGAWWAQTVTVGYERIRGLRQKGELCSGAFAASKSKTFPVPVSELYAWFAEGRRDRWMGVATAERTATPDRSMRLTWPDGTIVAAWFTDKGPAKSSVAIQHDKLASQERRQHEKLAWGERLASLGELLR